MVSGPRQTAQAVVDGIMNRYLQQSLRWQTASASSATNGSKSPGSARRTSTLSPAVGSRFPVARDRRMSLARDELDAVMLAAGGETVLLVMTSAQAKLGLGFGQGQPQPPPGGELGAGRPDELHRRRGVAGGQRRDVGGIAVQVGLGGAAIWGVRGVAVQTKPGPCRLCKEEGTACHVTIVRGGPQRERIRGFPASNLP